MYGQENSVYIHRRTLLDLFGGRRRLKKCLMLRKKKKKKKTISKTFDKMSKKKHEIRHSYKQIEILILFFELRERRLLRFSLRGGLILALEGLASLSFPSLHSQKSIYDYILIPPIPIDSLYSYNILNVYCLQAASR